jgi:VWFA-related protein
MSCRLSALLLLTLSPAAHAQAPETPTLRTGTQIVIVDVSVTDSHGNPVHNLKQSDFAIVENNSSQTITHFDEHTTPTAAVLAKQPAIPRLEPNVYTNFALAPEDGPINLLLVDTLNTSVDDQVNTRRQLLTFVKTMKPGTNLAVFALTTHLILLQGFTSDPQLLLAAVSSNKLVQNSPVMNDSIGTEAVSDRLRPFNERAAAGIQQSEAEQSTQMDNSRVIDTLSAMNQLARYLSGMPGRKNLIWLSGSFPLNFLPAQGNRSSGATTASFQQQLHDTTNLLAASQVAIYPVDSKGLTNSPLADATAGKYVMTPGAIQGDVAKSSAQTRDNHSTMRRIAEATGGKANLDTNDLRGAVDKAIDDGSNYYTLTYTPSGKKEDGSYRTISVHLATGDYNLSYREGYYANESASKFASSSRTAAKSSALSLDAMHTAMQHGAPAPSQILFKAILLASPESSKKPAEGNVVSPSSKSPYRLVTVAYAANPGDISMPLRPDNTRQVALEFIANVYDANGQLVTLQSNPVNVFVKPEGYRDFLKEGIRYQQQIAVPTKGEYFVRVGIHDMIGDKVGAVEVPAAAIANAPATPSKP